LLPSELVISDDQISNMSDSSRVVPADVGGSFAAAALPPAENDGDDNASEG